MLQKPHSFPPNVYTYTRLSNYKDMHRCLQRRMESNVCNRWTVYSYMFKRSIVKWME